MIPNHPNPSYRRGPQEPIDYSHREVAILIPETTAAILEHMRLNVAPHLAPDVSNYAKGRDRAWLEIEAPLGPTQPWRPGIHSERLWPWLVSTWHRAYDRTDPDLGLAIRGDTGITWHRDASYAADACLLVNLGPCTFEIDTERDAPPGKPAAPVSLPLIGGEVIAFNCKHQHRVIDAAPHRWSIVLWLLEQFPKRWCDPINTD